MLAAHSYPSLHHPGVFGLYVFVCNCMPSHLAPTHIRSLGRSVGRASIFFVLLLLFSSHPPPHQSHSRFSFFFSQLTFFISFYVLYIGPVNLFVFSAHNAL